MLGGVLLCVTGAEAMYADLGHFTRQSIQVPSSTLFPKQTLRFLSSVEQSWNRGLLLIDMLDFCTHIDQAFRVSTTPFSCVRHSTTLSCQIGLLLQCTLV